MKTDLLVGFRREDIVFGWLGLDLIVEWAPRRPFITMATYMSMVSAILYSAAEPDALAAVPSLAVSCAVAHVSAGAAGVRDTAHRPRCRYVLVDTCIDTCVDTPVGSFGLRRPLRS